MNNQPPGQGSDEPLPPAASSGRGVDPLSHLSLDDPRYAETVLDLAMRDATTIAKQSSESSQSEESRRFRSLSPPLPRSVRRRYPRAIRDHLGYSATLPMGQLRVGDIVIWSGDAITPISSLADLRLDVAVEGHSYVEDFTVQDYTLSTGKVSIEPAYGGVLSDTVSDRASIGFTFSGEGDLFGYWKRIRRSGIDNTEDLTEACMEVDASGQWSREWIVVSEVVEAARAVVVVAGEANSSARFMFEPPEGVDADSIDVVAGLGSPTLELVQSNGLAASLMINANFTPWFKAVRLQRGFLTTGGRLVPVDV